MAIFSKIINEETKELDCIDCGDTPVLEGYTSLEREQAYNGKWYLKGFAPQESPEEKRQRLDKLMLTPSDVERALYHGIGMDFDDLKAFISEQAPTIDMKGLAIEFRANNFYRGAVDSNGNRIVDMIGLLLGYNSDDMDYLFENKVLPPQERKNNDNTTC